VVGVLGWEEWAAGGRQLLGDGEEGGRGPPYLRSASLVGSGTRSQRFTESKVFQGGRGLGLPTHIREIWTCCVSEVSNRLTRGLGIAEDQIVKMLYIMDFIRKLGIIEGQY
jgi:hypothetical protein